MKHDIFEDAKKAAGCDYISDMKYMDKWIVSVFKLMNWSKYDAEDIKRLMCYLYGKQSNDIASSNRTEVRETTAILKKF